jgi:hypothetical protein
MLGVPRCRLPQEFGAAAADAGGRLMDSVAINALLITQGESAIPLFEGRDPAAVHLAAARV